MPADPVALLPCCVSLLMGWALAFSVTSASAQGVSHDLARQVLTDVRLGSCVTCHTTPEAGVASPVVGFGPSLVGVASRWPTSALRQWIVDARVLRPETLMPPFGTVEGLNRPAPARPALSPAQIDALVALLETWR